MRERLIGYGRGAWRRRWLGVGTAWLVCLIGWSATLLLTGAHGPSTPLRDEASADTALQAAGRPTAPDPLIVFEDVLAADAGNRAAQRGKCRRLGTGWPFWRTTSPLRSCCAASKPVVWPRCRRRSTVDRSAIHSTSGPPSSSATRQP